MQKAESNHRTTIACSCIVSDRGTSTRGLTNESGLASVSVAVARLLMQTTTQPGVTLSRKLEVHHLHLHHRCCWLLQQLWWYDDAGDRRLCKVANIGNRCRRRRRRRRRRQRSVGRLVVVQTSLQWRVDPSPPRCCLLHFSPSNPCYSAPSFCLRNDDSWLVERGSMKRRWESTTGPASEETRVYKSTQVH